MSHEGKTWREIAESNILEARKRNGRLGSRKSRGGCITCKSRRVKCDETHPECTRCVNGGRKCEYADSSPSRNSSHSPKSLTIGSQISQLSNLKEQDRRAFDFFLSGAAPRLAGPLDRDFWNGHVLQLAHAEPFVMDSLLAISTLYEHPQYLVSFRGNPFLEPERSDKKSSTLHLVKPQKTTPFDDDHAIALKHYNRAIAAFKSKVEAGQASPLLVTLSCALFICIEVIRDNIFVAFDLFAEGTKLMNQFINAKLTEEEERLMSIIRLIFSRLGILAAAFGHSNSLHIASNDIAVTQQTSYETLAEARNALFALMGKGHEFIKDASTYMSTNEPILDDVIFSEKFSSLRESSSPEDAIMLEATQEISPVAIAPTSVEDKFERITLGPDAIGYIGGYAPSKPQSKQNTSNAETLLVLQHRQQQIEQELQNWHDAAKNMPITTKDHPQVLSNLLLYYHVTLLWLSTRLHTSQTDFDQHDYHFEQILQHAEFFIAAQTPQRQTFIFEVGAVPPLYFVATKCRVPSLRRRALRLMARAPRKECMWGATSTAQLASRLIIIEEEGLGLSQPGWDGLPADGSVSDNVFDAIRPPEANRVHTIEILKNKLSGRHELRVTRYREDNSGRLVKREQDFAI